MARIAKDITWLVGRTPLVNLHHLAPSCRLLAKLEFFNPSGSNKDRTALGMIEHAEQSGFLEPGGTLVECTSGDLGLSIAMIGRRRGYRVILTMPQGTPEHRRSLLAALSAELVLTDPDLGMRGAMEKAEEIARQTEGAVCLQAFTNRSNAKKHLDTTAREIWEDTDGQVRAVVVPIGTGGTAAGCATLLRPRGVRVIGVEPTGSAVLSGGAPGAHDIPGIGAGFIPDILRIKDLDEVLTVSDQQARNGVQKLARDEAILVGPAGGAVISAALEIARRPDYRDTVVTAVLPDSGERCFDHRAYRLED